MLIVAGMLSHRRDCEDSRNAEDEEQALLNTDPRLKICQIR